MPDQVEIVQVQKVPADPRTRFGKSDVLVSYRRTDKPVRTVSIPEEVYNDVTMKDAIRKDIAAADLQAGRTISV